MRLANHHLRPDAVATIAVFLAACTAHPAPPRAPLGTHTAPPSTASPSPAPNTSPSAGLPAALTQQAEPAMPAAVQETGAAAGVLGGVTVVAGGEPVPETSLVPIVQELRDGTWSGVPMLVPRHGTGNAVFEGRLWLCGGGTAAGIHPTASCTSIGD